MRPFGHKGKHESKDGAQWATKQQFDASKLGAGEVPESFKQAMREAKDGDFLPMPPGLLMTTAKPKRKKVPESFNYAMREVGACSTVEFRIPIGDKKTVGAIEKCIELYVQNTPENRKMCRKMGFNPVK